MNKKFYGGGPRKSISFWGTLPFLTQYEIYTETDISAVGDIMQTRQTATVKKYIANQVQEDKPAEQMSKKEYIDPFTGEPTKESK